MYEGKICNKKADPGFFSWRERGEGVVENLIQTKNAFPNFYMHQVEL